MCDMNMAENEISEQIFKFKQKYQSMKMDLDSKIVIDKKLAPYNAFLYMDMKFIKPDAYQCDYISTTLMSISIDLEEFEKFIKEKDADSTLLIVLNKSGHLRILYNINSWGIDLEISPNHKVINKIFEILFNNEQISESNYLYLILNGFCDNIGISI